MTSDDFSNVKFRINESLFENYNYFIKYNTISVDLQRRPIQVNQA